MSLKKKSFTMLKILFMEVIVSIILLFVGAFVTLKMSPSDKTISYIVIAIYAISAFVGGFIAGKAMEKQKFLWGLVAGICYVALILIVAMAVKGNVSSGSIGLVKMIVPSLVAGILGGMVS